jgi:hypothetical protein
VHVGPDGLLAEGILEELVRATDPAAAMGVLKVIDDPQPTRAGRRLRLALSIESAIRSGRVAT